MREVVVFHSPDAELLPYQGRFPFDVIGDPAETLYRQYGVRKSLLAILDPRAWPASLKGYLRKDKPVLKGFPNGGPLGLPADFLIGVADWTARKAAELKMGQTSIRGGN